MLLVGQVFDDDQHEQAGGQKVVKHAQGPVIHTKKTKSRTFRTLAIIPFTILRFNDVSYGKGNKLYGVKKKGKTILK